MIRVAAVGDVHLGKTAAGRLRPKLQRVAAEADVLLVAGDLTNYGTAQEGAVAAGELRDLGLPVVAVLGNHDHESGQQQEVAAALVAAGIEVLDGTATVLEVDGQRLGVAGVKGFGGGFTGTLGAEFGEAEMKAFMAYSRAQAAALARGMESLVAAGCELRIALMHYAPVPETLEGEAVALYPFLGSSFLAEVVDSAGAALALHGHAHAGSEVGVTPGGVPVRNVAMPVLGRPYAVYEVG